MKDSYDSDDKPSGKWRFLAVFVLVTGLLVLVFPFVVCIIPWPEFTIDLTEALGENAALFEKRTLTVLPTVSRHDGAYRLSASGQLLDWPFTASATIRLGFFSAKGSAKASLDGTPWRLTTEFDASSLHAWKASIHVPKTKFSERDPVIAPILPRLDLTAVSNLVFSGSLSIDAEASRTNQQPFIAWSAKTKLHELDVSANASGIPIDIDNLACGAEIRGIANHFDILPFRPHATKVEVLSIPLTNVYATVYANGSQYLVTEAGAGCDGGNIRAYSVSLDTTTLSSGFTLVLDGIDAGAVLQRLYAFNGEATGRLNGKIQLFLRNGSELRLRESYLYSIPGEIGKIRIADSAPIVANLAAGGVPEASCANISKALTNLDYELLKINLRREAKDSLALNLALSGSATSGKTTVPVSFDITFHGNLNELINVGLKAKGKSK